jgi:2-dehydropantoate 2-reductase
MRSLVLGAGAVGGYFGGRLLEAGRDVTFLVRPRRAAQLAEHGLRIASPNGDVHLAAPPTVTTDRIGGPFDLILLACKAYDLADAIASVAPAVGATTAIVPLLNGMRHLDVLSERFPGRVLGGECVVSSTLTSDGTIVHFNPLDTLVYGELDGSATARVAAIEREMAGVRFTATASTTVLHDMWEKWTFLACFAALTCLMRGSIADIIEGGGTAVALAMYGETSAVAEANGFGPRPPALERSHALLKTPSPATASMLRDIENGNRIEADHVVGDLLARAPQGLATPLLSLAYLHLKTYEARRRTANADGAAS